MACWDRAEADIAAVFDDGPTRTMQIYIRILAIVHSNLPRSHNNNTVLDTGDMSRTCHVTCNNQRVLDVLQRKAGKGGALAGWRRHINNASA